LFLSLVGGRLAAKGSRSLCDFFRVEARNIQTAGFSSTRLVKISCVASRALRFVLLNNTRKAVASVLELVSAFKFEEQNLRSGNALLAHVDVPRMHSNLRRS